MVIIMTDCKGPFGSYVDFNVKGSGERVAEVDRSDGKYKIYGGKNFTLIGERTGKQSAISFAQESIKGLFREQVEFKWNVVSKNYRWK